MSLSISKVAAMLVRPGAERTDGYPASAPATFFTAPVSAECSHVVDTKCSSPFESCLFRTWFCLDFLRVGELLSLSCHGSGHPSHDNVILVNEAICIWIRRSKTDTFS